MEILSFSFSTLFFTLASISFWTSFSKNPSWCCLIISFFIASLILSSSIFGLTKLIICFVSILGVWENQNSTLIHFLGSMTNFLNDEYIIIHISKINIYPHKRSTSSVIFLASFSKVVRVVFLWFLKLFKWASIPFILSLSPASYAWCCRNFTISSNSLALRSNKLYSIFTRSLCIISNSLLERSARSFTFFRAIWYANANTTLYNIKPTQNNILPKSVITNYGQ